MTIKPSNYEITDVLRYGNEGETHFLLRLLPASTKAGGAEEVVFTGILI